MSKKAKVCRHFIVSGKVQGVFYRANTQIQAQQLGLTGWVKNLNDKRVEVFACGDYESVGQLYRWLKHGPPAADVQQVTIKNLPYQAHCGFTIQY